MRVTLVSTNDDGGGAAIAARRLHQALNASRDAQSTMLVRYPSGQHAGVVTPSSLETPSIREHIELAERDWRIRLIRERRTPGSEGLVSLPYPDPPLFQEPCIKGADIVHAHWVTNFIGPGALTEVAAAVRPLVITLHDMRYLTGGCHYAGTCDQWMASASANCAACPELIDGGGDWMTAAFEDSRRLFEIARPHIVTPSNWLADQVRASAMLGHCDVSVIPNGIDHTVFSPDETHAPDHLRRVALRRQWNVNDDTMVVFFAVDHLGERRKGGRILHDALRILVEQDPGVRSRLCAWVAGKPRDDASFTWPIPTRWIGAITSEGQMAAAYRASDLHVLPSLQDNLPNTILEAMACGCPVVSTDVGGVPDLIEDGAEGWLVPANDPSALAACLSCRLDHAEERHECGRRGRVRVESDLTLGHLARRHLALYRSLSRSPMPREARVPRDRVAPHFRDVIQAESPA